MAVRLLRPDVHRRGIIEIPVPGRSQAKQRFWRQESGSIPGLQKTDNLLLLWRDDAGVLAEPLTLVRPVGGDHQRRNLRVQWVGRLDRGMAALRTEDLNGLRPDVDNGELVGGGAS